jgi:hypothetical protein
MDYNYDYDYSEQLYTTTTSNPEAAAAAIAITGGFVLFTLLILAVIYVVSAIFLGMIFKKAGVKPWIAWVPFYNSWKMLELGGQQGFWAVLAIIPIVNYVSAVFMYIAMYHIGKKLGKDGVFVLLAIFLPIVWLIWLAVDKSTWNDKASTAPSLHKG